MFDSKKKVKGTTTDGLEQKLTKSQYKIVQFNRCLLFLYSNQVCPLLNRSTLSKVEIIPRIIAESITSHISQSLTVTCAAFFFSLHDFVFLMTCWTHDLCNS